MKTVRFIMAIHNHQPVGNFEHVFRKACTRAYHPFLDVFDAFPRIRMVLHYSGPLLEWIEENDPKLVSRIKQGVGQNRFELLGSPYGEPILTMLPDRDALGQIRLFQRHLRDRYNTTPRGAWLAERVWESYLARILADAGVEYTVVDDFHFLAAGLRENDLAGYYTVEDQGRVLEIAGGMVSVCDGWRTGPSRDKEARWDAAELGDVLRGLIDESDAPQKVHGT